MMMTTVLIFRLFIINISIVIVVSTDVQSSQSYINIRDGDFFFM